MNMPRRPTAIIPSDSRSSRLTRHHSLDNRFAASTDHESTVLTPNDRHITCTGAFIRGLTACRWENINAPV